MKYLRIPIEARIALLYLLFSGMWLLLTNHFLFLIYNVPFLLSLYQTYNGWFFIAASSLLIYLLLHRHLALKRLLDEELRENEERYSLLFNSSLDAIFLTAPDGGIYAANPSACGIFGRSEAEICKIGFSGLLDGTDARLELAREEHSRTAHFFGGLVYIRKDGTRFPGETSAAVYTDKAGIERTSIIIRDITERKKAEEQLRLQSKALESAANAIVITGLDGKIQWVNPAFEALTGYSAQEAIGQNPRILRSGLQANNFYRNLWDTILTGKVWHSELVNKRKDGSLYTEEETITPLFDPTGRITHLIGIKQDISDRKKSEKLLLESEERLRLALNAAKQGIFDLNVHTREVIVNDIYATMLGYDPATFIETTDCFIKRTHPEEREAAYQVYRSYISGELPAFRIESHEQILSGEWKWILSIGRIVERDPNGHPLRMIGTRMDITESKNSALEIARLLEESQRRLQRISTLYEIDAAISSNNNLGITLNVLLAQVKSQLKADAVAVLLFDEEQKAFRYAASLGFQSNKIENANVKLENSLAGKAAQKGKMIQIQNIDDDIDPAFAVLIKEENLHDYYGIPLIAKGRLKGVLELFHHSRLNPDGEWLNYFEALAGQAALAIENAQLIEGLKNANEELTQAYDATIEGWSMAMDLRDKETEGHTQRVTEMSIGLARKMHFSEEDIIQIRRGALLHDVGKMGIPDAILLKAGLLTPEELTIMQRHPKYAYDLLQSIDYLRPALAIPHYHHEKWDGTGYPCRLKGEEIPFTARLFAIVDVYDALISDRPYRTAWTKQETLRYIMEQSGKHFDPEVVRLFLEYIQESQSTS
jgi:PAS domain S-box-containing protein